jgi:subtilisin family serine protease
VLPGVDTNRGRLSIGTAGSTFGHNGGVNTITVAAVSNNFLPINRRFLASDTTTTYSSGGPRKLFLNPVPATTAITPGCFLFACGGTTLQKVDIAAADCDTTTTPGFAPFCGTSAAAPNSAAIAALIKSRAPGLTNAQILARMKFTVLDIMAAGVDRDSGSGIVMADAAHHVTCSSGPVTFGARYRFRVPSSCAPHRLDIIGPNVQIAI